MKVKMEDYPEVFLSSDVAVSAVWDVEGLFKVSIMSKAWTVAEKRLMCWELQTDPQSNIKSPLRNEIWCYKNNDGIFVAKRVIFNTLFQKNKKYSFL